MAGPSRQDFGLTSDNQTGFVEQEETSSLVTTRSLKKRKGSVGKELGSIEWTDEKHSLYLKSMEASFVDQLYRSKDMFGRRSQNGHLLSSDVRLCRQENHCASGQGLCFGKARLQAEEATEHKIISTGYKSDIGPSAYRQIHGFRNTSLSYAREKLTSNGSANMLKQYFVCEKLQDSEVGNEAEVSDQNFVDEGGDRDSGGPAHRNKRLKPLESTSSMSNDQVVPLGKSQCPLLDLSEGCSASNRMVDRDDQTMKTGSAF